MAPRINFNDGQEILHDDLNKVAQAIEREVMDRILYELSGRQADFLFSDSLKVTWVSATSVQVAAGLGVQTDNAQVDPEPVKRLLRVSTATAKTLAAADATNPRIDIVSVKAARAVIDTEARNFKDATTDDVTEETMDVETDWESDLVVTTGTPAGSPVVPTTPAGYIKLCEIAVPAVTGPTGNSNITDRRTLYKRPSSWKQTRTITAGETLTQDDEVIFCNSSSPMTVVFPAAALMAGRVLQIVNINTGVVTEDGNSTELLNGAQTQTIDTQYSAHKWLCNGTAWYLVA